MINKKIMLQNTFFKISILDCYKYFQTWEIKNKHFFEETLFKYSHKFNNHD